MDAKEIVDHYMRMRQRNAARDQRWRDVTAIRDGRIEDVAPQLVTPEFPKPIIANFVDTVARDLAEMIAPLPAFQCSSTSMASDAGRRFADKRTKIVQAYIQHCRLDRQMFMAADQFNSFAGAVFYIEPDFDAKMPHICAEDATGGYAEYGRWGQVASYTKRWWAQADVLARMFPEFRGAIEKAQQKQTSESMVEIIRYCDKDMISLVLVAEKPLMLTSTANPLKETPVVIARRFGLTPESNRGQYDDVIWVQIARDMIAKLNVEAVEKAVQAPLAVPNDVQEFSLGADGVIRSDSPDKIRRVGVELPQAGFAEAGVLMQEMQQGARYPAARAGGVDASIITGKGVQALLGGFDGQVKAAQLAFRDALSEVVRLCFKMDETYWPNVEKNIRGQANGTPYEIKYRPSKDIAGDHACSVEYGFAAGMDPNRAVVMLLQLRAEKTFSRDYFRRQLPFELNIGEEERKVDTEDMREGIKQGLLAYVQAIPAMAQAGQDPADAVAKMAAIVEGIQKGDPIERVAAKVFAPAPSPPQAGAGPGGAPPGQPGTEPGGMGGPGGGTVGGLDESGLMQGVPAGQAGQAPGGRPDLSVAMAGLTGNGQPQMSSYVMRRRRV